MHEIVTLLRPTSPAAAARPRVCHPRRLQPWATKPLLSTERQGRESSGKRVAVVGEHLGFRADPGGWDSPQGFRERARLERPYEARVTRTGAGEGCPARFRGSDSLLS